VAHLEARRPDVLVLIDYPGFNIRLAKKAKALGIPIVYYISPQVWAWKKGRIHTIADLVDRVLVILPFEERLYTEVGADCTYVGHPLVDRVASVPISGEYRGGLVIGILPGSREQEVHRLLGPMIEVARAIRAQHPEARFVTPCANDARERQVQAMRGDSPLETTVGRMYEVLDGARFCLVASGTATVEAALFGVPMAILYRVSPLNYWLARWLVDIEHIGMVNILAGRRAVPEFVQHAVRADRIVPTALELIEDTPARRRMLDDLAEVRHALGEAGASQRAAEAVLEVAGKRRDANGEGRSAGG